MLHLVDIVSIEKRSQMMAGIKAKNTKPEILVQKILHASGFRFRLHGKTFPGKPDIVLPKHKSVIFVQGCFWHGHQMCPVFRLPKSRTDFWQEKIEGNRLRDERSRGELIRHGWKVIYVWECAVKGRTRMCGEQLKNDISKAVRSDDIDFFEIRGLPIQPVR